jgi:hypothetical protein
MNARLFVLQNASNGDVLAIYSEEATAKAMVPHIELKLKLKVKVISVFENIAIDYVGTTMNVKEVK